MIKNKDINKKTKFYISNLLCGLCTVSSSYFCFLKNNFLFTNFHFALSKFDYLSGNNCGDSDLC